MTRCPICGNRGRHRRAGAVAECTHCALRLHPGARPPALLARDIAGRLGSPCVDLVADPPHDWSCGIATLRIAGYRFGRAVRPADAAQAAELAHPTGTLPARATTAAFAATGPAIALGLLGRPADRAAIATLCARIGHRFAAVAVLIDAADPALVAGLSHGTIRYAAHPLGGDFSAQRNRLTDLCDTPWQLQLDADEDLDPALLDALPALAADADAHGLRTLAFPRRNLVDGAAADLWPDVQYRLNRTDVRFAGVVHERPITARDWTQSALAPAGAIVHRLTGDHVRARTLRYGAMAADGARRGDQDALLRPFDPD